MSPAASGFSGTLLGGSVTGTGTLDFKATDPGPGVYQARAKVDGQQVWAATPNLNEGKCVSTGSLEGVRAFNYAQPCPTETAVHAEINTAGLPDGTHALTVEVEDAAGDVTTVYSGTLTHRQPRHRVHADRRAVGTRALQRNSVRGSRQAHRNPRRGDDLQP